MFEEQSPEEVRLIEQLDAINQEMKEIGIEKTACRYELDGIIKNKKFDTIETGITGFLAAGFLLFIAAQFLFSWGNWKFALVVSFGSGGTPIWAAITLIAYICSQFRYWLKNSEREFFRNLADKMSVHNRAMGARNIQEKLEKLNNREDELRKSKMVVNELMDKLYELQLQKKREKEGEKEILEEELKKLLPPEKRMDKGLSPAKQYQIQTRDEYFNTSKSIDDELDELQKLKQNPNTEGENPAMKERDIQKKEAMFNPSEYELPEIKSNAGGDEKNPLFSRDMELPKSEEIKLRKNDLPW